MTIDNAIRIALTTVGVAVNVFAVVFAAWEAIPSIILMWSCLGVMWLTAS